MEELTVAKEQISQLQFKLANIQHDVVSYYTGFSSYHALKIFYNYLGPAVNHLLYSQEAANSSDDVSKQYHPRILPPMEEIVLDIGSITCGTV